MLGLGLCGLLPTLHGQVVLDGKFGTRGALTGPNFNVTADLGLTRGNNLFHSFSQFDLKAGDVATFSGPANIKNVLSRVTGASPSSIDGTIRSGIPGANFYFINPGGVVFGPDAAVDVSGAFAVSSANYLKLDDDARFVASLEADDSMLSSAPVAAFGFLEGASGMIEVGGALRSAPGTPLTVIGSSVMLKDGANLEAIGAQISLTGVSTPGELPVSQPATIRNTLPKATAANSPGTVVIRGGRLVVQNAGVSVTQSGGDLRVAMSESVEILNGGVLTTASAGSAKGGDIVIETPRLVVDSQDEPLPTRVAAETTSEDALGAGGNILIRSDSLELLRGAEISVSTFGAANAGRVDIQTGKLRIAGSDVFTFPTQISANAAPVFGLEFGSGGQVVIQADSVELGMFAAISASTLGDPDAGSIDITARSISINDSSVTTYSSGAGKGGDIRVSSDSLALDGPFGSITALAFGVDGNLPAGNGGNITIQTGSLQLRNDAAISASTYGDGRGGDIRINARSIALDTGHEQPFVVAGISSSSNPSLDGTENRGRGGNVFIAADSLDLRNGMKISVATATPGNGGNIEVQAGSVSLSGQSAIQSSSEASGLAGTITVRSGGDIRLAEGGSISTSAPRSSAGEIRVSSGGEIRLTDSQIAARAGPGGGGNISVEAPDLVYVLRGALDAQAEGDGGNLTIGRPVSVILNESGLISKSSSANGGNITIQSDYFLTSTSLIDASAPFGLPGTVQVTAPDVDLSGMLVELPGNLLDARSLLRPDCAVRLTEGISSFVILGRGGLPLAPGGFVPSGLFWSPDEKQ